MPTPLCRDKDADTYRTLFDIEAYLRLLVRWESRGAAGRAWTGIVGADLVAKAKERRTQESEDGIIDPLESGLLSYLLLSELKDVLTGSLWPRCAPWWRSSLEIVKNEFKKLIAVRNKVAHFRPVTEWDTKVVTRFAEDLTRWTRPYRKLREMEVSWKLGTPVDGDFPGVLKKYKLVDVLPALQAMTCSPGDEFSAAVVGHHVALRVTRSGGALDPRRVSECLLNSERDVTIARIGAFGASLEILVPAVLGAGPIKDLVMAVSHSVEGVSEAVASADLPSSYGLDRQEGVLADVVSFPGSFEVSSGNAAAV